MCYFLTLVTKKPFDEKTMEMMMDVGVYLGESTDIVEGRLPDRHYTQILRGCSCDFVSNKWDVLEIVYEKALEDGDFLLSCMYDDGHYRDIGVCAQQAIEDHPVRELPYEEFLQVFPEYDQPNITFHVTRNVS